MSTMNISLPAAMQKAMMKRVKAGQYSTSSEYIRDLIRRDIQASEHLRQLILEGLKSPVVAEAGPEYFAELRRRAAAMKK